MHAKDVRLDVLDEVVAERAGMIEAWARVFCPSAQGDVDLPAFFAALAESGYTGWVVVEQDRIPSEDEPLSSRRPTRCTTAPPSCDAGL